MPLDAITQANALEITPNLTMMMNQWWRWVRGVCLGSQGCQVCQKYQDNEPQAVAFLFIEPQDSESRWAVSGWPDALTGRTPASGRSRLSTWPRLNQCRSISIVTKQLALESIDDRTWRSDAPDAEQRGVRSFPERFQSHSQLTGRVQSTLTWRVRRPILTGAHPQCRRQCTSATT
jgi:hypothetical protein